jgi:hypothetical protein
MPNIYVVNKGGHDLSAAMKHGEKLIFLSEGEQNRFALNSMYRKFKPILDESQPDDFLLMTGLTNMCAVASAIFGHKHGRVNWLLFYDGRYIKRTILLDE